jgi:hypothetical protein
VVGVGGPPVRSVGVSNQSPILCFGITAEGKRSSYWRLRAGVAKPELFLEREGYGKKFHFSLHASGQWHMKEGRHERISWARPGEVVPGYTRAVGIVQPVATAVREDPPAEEPVLVPVPADADPTTFSVFIERPGANLNNSWPAKNADGTTFVRPYPIGWWCRDLLHHRPAGAAPAGQGGVPSPDQRRAAVDAGCGCARTADHDDHRRADRWSDRTHRPACRRECAGNPGSRP